MSYLLVSHYLGKIDTYKGLAISMASAGCNRDAATHVGHGHRKTPTRSLGRSQEPWEIVNKGQYFDGMIKYPNFQCNRVGKHDRSA